MSDTAFAGIQAAIVQALTAAPALACGRVYTNHLRPIGAGFATALVVRLDQSAGSAETLGALDWVTGYVVECYSRAATGTDPADAVDALLADAWARLNAINPTALGVSALTVQPAIDWQYDTADTPVTCALIRVQVQHRTTTGTLAPWA